MQTVKSAVYFFNTKKKLTSFRIDFRAQTVVSIFDILQTKIHNMKV